MNEQAMARILGDCLARMAAGETPAACLLSYPEHAAELAPLLAQAGELGLWRNYRLDEATRRRQRTRLLQAAASSAGRPRAAQPWWRGQFALPRLATTALVIVLCLVLATGMVAASAPGDLAYGVRVAVERAPVLLTRDAAGRARAELGIAARRLADLDRTMASQMQDLDTRTLSALLVSVENAARSAAHLPAGVRAEVAARLAEQAERLATLEEQARSAPTAAALQTAAQRTEAAAVQVSPPDLPSVIPADEPTATPSAPATPASVWTIPPTRPATHPPSAELAPTATSEPTVTVTGPHASATPQGPRADATHEGPGPRLTPQGPSGDATPEGPYPDDTPQGPHASATPKGPGLGATPQGPGASATPQGPSPSATPNGTGPDSTPQGPGPDTTPQGPGSDATPQGPGASATPQGSGPAATRQGPGGHNDAQG